MCNLQNFGGSSEKQTAYRANDEHSQHMCWVTEECMLGYSYSLYSFPFMKSYYDDSFAWCCGICCGGCYCWESAHDGLVAETDLAFYLLAKDSLVAI